MNDPLADQDDSYMPNMMSDPEPGGGMFGSYNPTNDITTETYQTSLAPMPQQQQPMSRAQQHSYGMQSQQQMMQQQQAAYYRQQQMGPGMMGGGQPQQMQGYQQQVQPMAASGAMPPGMMQQPQQSTPAQPELTASGKPKRKRQTKKQKEEAEAAKAAAAQAAQMPTSIPPSHQTQTTPTALQQQQQQQPYAQSSPAYGQPQQQQHWPPQQQQQQQQYAAAQQRMPPQQSGQPQQPGASDGMYATSSSGYPQQQQQQQQPGFPPGSQIDPYSQQSQAQSQSQYPSQYGRQQTQQPPTQAGYYQQQQRPAPGGYPAQYNQAQQAPGGYYTSSGQYVQQQPQSRYVNYPQQQQQSYPTSSSHQAVDPQTQQPQQAVAGYPPQQYQQQQQQQQYVGQQQMQPTNKDQDHYRMQQQQNWGGRPTYEQMQGEYTHYNQQLRMLVQQQQQDANNPQLQEHIRKTQERLQYLSHHMQYYQQQQQQPPQYPTAQQQQQQQRQMPPQQQQQSQQQPQQPFSPQQQQAVDQMQRRPASGSQPTPQHARGYAPGAQPTSQAQTPPPPAPVPPDVARQRQAEQQRMMQMQQQQQQQQPHGYGMGQMGAPPNAAQQPQQQPGPGAPAYQGMPPAGGPGVHPPTTMTYSGQSSVAVNIQPGANTLISVMQVPTAPGAPPVPQPMDGAGQGMGPMGAVSNNDQQQSQQHPPEPVPPPPMPTVPTKQRAPRRPRQPKKQTLAAQQAARAPQVAGMIRPPAPQAMAQPSIPQQQQQQPIAHKPQPDTQMPPSGGMQQQHMGVRPSGPPPPTIEAHPPTPKHETMLSTSDQGKYWVRDIDASIAATAAVPQSQPQQQQPIMSPSGPTPSEPVQQPMTGPPTQQAMPPAPPSETSLLMSAGEPQAAKPEPGASGPLQAQAPPPPSATQQPQSMLNLNVPSTLSINTTAETSTGHAAGGEPRPPQCPPAAMMPGISPISPPLQAPPIQQQQQQQPMQESPRQRMPTPVAPSTPSKELVLPGGVKVSPVPSATSGSQMEQAPPPLASPSQQQQQPTQQLPASNLKDSESCGGPTADSAAPVALPPTTTMVSPSARGVDRGSTEPPPLCHVPQFSPPPSSDVVMPTVATTAMQQQQQLEPELMQPTGTGMIEPSGVVVEEADTAASGVAAPCLEPGAELGAGEPGAEPDEDYEEGTKKRRQRKKGGGAKESRAKGRRSRAAGGSTPRRGRKRKQQAILDDDEELAIQLAMEEEPLAETSQDNELLSDLVPKTEKETVKEEQDQEATGDQPAAETGETAAEMPDAEPAVDIVPEETPKKRSRPAKSRPDSPMIEKPKTFKYATPRRRARKKKRKSFESDESAGEELDNIEPEPSREKSSKKGSKAAKHHDEIPEDLVEKRRSGRIQDAGKRKRYVEPDPEQIEDEEEKSDNEKAVEKDNSSGTAGDRRLQLLKDETSQLDDSGPATPQLAVPVLVDDSSLVVEKILAFRIRSANQPHHHTLGEDESKETPRAQSQAKDEKKEKSAEEDSAGTKKEEEEEDDSEKIEEYFVKFKNFSYLHCAWKTADELEQGDKRVAGKIKRFQLKREQATTFLDEQYDEDEPFNPDFIQVERVLAVSVEQVLVQPPLPPPVPDKELADGESDEKKESESVAGDGDADELKVKPTTEEDEATESQAAETSAADVEPESEREGDEAQESTTSSETKAPEDQPETDSKEEKPAADQEQPVPDKESAESKSEPGDEGKEEDKESTDGKKTPEKMETEEGADEEKPSSVKGENVEEQENEKEQKLDAEDKEEEEENEEKEKSLEREDSVMLPEPVWETVTHYLVKWRSLAYEECTWELEKDVDSTKVKEYRRRESVTSEKLKDKSRPHSSEWRKVNQNPTFKNNNELREYQLEGLNWLLFCWYNRQNCILADEMGLGKTIQTIVFFVQMQSYGVRGPLLVIAPLSTIHNWQREFETWSDINAVLYHGTAVSRQMIQEYEFYFRDENNERIAKAYKFDVLITTYEMILTDYEELKSIAWRCCVIDEAHRLKNRNCKLLTGLSQFKMEHRVLLTGTPLQNNMDELFSLMNFLEPKQFANSQLFLSEFGQCQSDEQVSKLQDILKPMMLRRLKEDVEKELKPKEETIVEVELTNPQKKYYRAILERNFTYLSKGGSVPSLMNTMMELRKCCNHPFLINGAEESILQEFQLKELDEDEQFHQALVQSAGKMVLIDKLLPKLRNSGHKVLIFSQMVRCLDLLEEYLLKKKYPFERIDGNVRGDLRQMAIDRFSKPDSDRFVFLLCTRAGGLGINLTAADTVIIYDSDWNPQNDLQAQARCHRIGQEKYVKIYRLITRNTYEREMFDKASLKLGLDKAVLQSMGPKENLAAQLSKKEVEELLRKGAYGAIMDETNEGDKFSEEDIDTILQRRTQTITIEAGVKGSTFAKASFNVSSNREDIDVNDPNFWQKWARKANVDPNINPEAALILYEPRQRKRRFDEDMYRHDMGSGEESTTESEDSQGGKRKRKRDDKSYMPDELAFTKSDYFKVEKWLATFGWGRWTEILAHCDFKQTLTDEGIEHMCRTVLLHCLRTFTGDEKIREFVWELISIPYEAPPDEVNENVEKLAAQQRKQAKKSAQRGQRKSRRATTQQSSEKSETSADGSKTLSDQYHQGWAALPAYNPPSLAVDYAYQRHLQRHANKVLMRIRMLHLLEHDFIGPVMAIRIRSNEPVADLDLIPPFHPELPCDWWDMEADKSLLVGYYKHGYEMIQLLRDDPALCFLSRCGPSPESQMIAQTTQPPSVEEQQKEEEEKDNDTEETAGDDEKPDEKPETTKTKSKAKEKSAEPMETDKEKGEESPTKTEPSGGLEEEKEEKEVEEDEDREQEKQKKKSKSRRKKGKRGKRERPSAAQQQQQKDSADENKTPEETEEVEVKPVESTDAAATPAAAAEDTTTTESPYLPFPSTAELNARFRRLMTLYQRTARVVHVKEDQMKKKSARFEQTQALLQEREFRKLSERQRWSRREENDFYRTLVGFGVEGDLDNHEYDWARFKRLAKLDHKFDQTLSDYYLAFTAMCKRVCHKPMTPVEESLSIIPESVSEERANKVLQRVEFMTRIRTAIKHPKLAERIVNCKRTPDLPTWWEPGTKHDIDLLRGVAKHGLNKCEEYIIPDTEFCFQELWRKLQKESAELKEKEQQQQQEQEQQKNKEKTAEATEEPGEKPEDKELKSAVTDLDMTISQILAQQSVSVLHWPKERMLIFRLQNICYTIEHGDWPCALGVRGATGVGGRPSATVTPAQDIDAQSETTDRETPRDTPALLFGDEARDSPSIRPSTPKTQTQKRGRKPKQWTAQTAAGATLPTSSSSSTPRASSQPGGQGAGANPLQDLMEAEKERMRALMHQSFLQQLEQFPFAAAAMGAAGGLNVPGLTAEQAAEAFSPSTLAALAQSLQADSAALHDQQVLNLSTKKATEKKQQQQQQAAAAAASKASTSAEADQSTSAAAAAASTLAGLQFNDIMQLANMPPDTRVPVVNLKDGSRLTGADAPTLRNLAQWLGEHPNYVFDLPTSADQLEPGEIRRPAKTEPPAVARKADVSPERYITVVHRKEGHKLTGSKAPTLKTIATWLEKNPDWDVDQSCAQMVKPVLSDKSRIAGTRQQQAAAAAAAAASVTTRSQTSTSASTASIKQQQQQQQQRREQEAAAAAASQSQAQAQAQQLAALAALDPFTAASLLGSLDPASQLQMQAAMLMGANPSSLLGVTTSSAVGTQQLQQQQQQAAALMGLSPGAFGGLLGTSSSPFNVNQLSAALGVVPTAVSTAPSSSSTAAKSDAAIAAAAKEASRRSVAQPQLTSVTTQPQTTATTKNTRSGSKPSTSASVAQQKKADAAALQLAKQQQQQQQQAAADLSQAASLAALAQDFESNPFLAAAALQAAGLDPNTLAAAQAAGVFGGAGGLSPALLGSMLGTSGTSAAAAAAQSEQDAANLAAMAQLQSLMTGMGPAGLAGLDPALMAATAGFGLPLSGLGVSSTSTPGFTMPSLTGSSTQTTTQTAPSAATTSTTPSASSSSAPVATASSGTTKKGSTTKSVSKLNELVSKLAAAQKPPTDDSNNE